MLADMLLATLRICGIILLVEFTAAIVGSLIDAFFGKKK